jgi:hypothetical protein
MSLRAALGPSFFEADMILLEKTEMERRDLKNGKNYLNMNIYSYLETSGGQSSNLYLNVVRFFNASAI